MENTTGSLQKLPTLSVNSAVPSPVACSTRCSLSWGVRQGCVMSAFLFIIIMDWLIKNVTEQQRAGIEGTLCTCTLHQTWRLIGISSFPSHARAQKRWVRWHSQHHWALDQCNKESNSINNQALEFVDKFSYLGSIVNLHGGTKEDISWILHHVWVKQESLLLAWVQYRNSILTAERPNSGSTELTYYQYC